MRRQPALGQVGAGLIANDGDSSHWDDALRDRAINDTDRLWALSGRLYRHAG